MFILPKTSSKYITAWSESDVTRLTNSQKPQHTSTHTHTSLLTVSKCKSNSTLPCQPNSPKPANRGHHRHSTPPPITAPQPHPCSHSQSPTTLYCTPLLQRKHNLLTHKGPFLKGKRKKQQKPEIQTAMSNRTGSHQLSNGLIVSGRPELKERQPTMSSRSVIYTGGDVRKSGELGRMYGVDQQPPSRTPSGSARSGPNSGQQPPPKLSHSGPLNKKLSSSSSFSGPLTPIQPTGLITSGPTGSARRSGQLEGLSVEAAPPPRKAVYGSAVTSIKEDARLAFRVSRLAVWAFLIVVVMGLVVGAFLMVAVQKAVILVAVVALLVPAMVVVAWNYARRRRGVVEFLKGYPDCSVREAVDGEYIKVTGVVTCGNIPLETSFQRIPRCVYVSTELYEYRGCRGIPANSKHRFFSWGCRHSEKYVADFYVSDNVTGARALVKTGFGAKVATFVEPTLAVDVTKDNRELSPNFVRWLSDRGLSIDHRVMRLKESYVKEGNIVSVMGMVRRHDNVIMIVPPEEPLTTACRLPCCLLPAYVEGLILMSDQGPNDDVIPV